MDRRDFIKTSATLAASGAISRYLPGEAFQGSNAQQSGRLVLPINRNWRYNGRLPEGFEAPGFDDSGFEKVVIPHTNKRLPWHGFDDKSYEFVSAYRRHFRLPVEAKGKHVFVDFQGAMTASTVWINGQRLGEYKGGYTPFSYELTPHIDWNGDNLLAVELDSSERADIPPFGGEIDYLTFGGIYRDVRLRLVNPIYLENIFAKPQDVLTDHPGVNVACFVARLEKQSGPLTLEAELRDGDRVLAHAVKTVPP